jgi:phenylacetate-CoA ligase
MILRYIKKHSSINPHIGKMLNYIPFTSRPIIGRTYKESLNNLNTFEILSESQKKSFIFNRISNLVNFSYKNVFFYKDFYSKNNFSPLDLKNFDDIKKIPIISKSDLNNYSLEERSSTFKNGSLVNTGGSSGHTLFFYIPDSLIGNEWAHMHRIWSKLEYKFSDLKLVFAGRSDVLDFVQYDFVRNQFSVDIYSDYKIIAPKLKQTLSKFKIQYLHGYPSSIYMFAQFCKHNDPELLQLIRSNLKGVFLSSEYPYEIYRNLIEQVFKVDTISWYGHTERAILAYEKHEKGVYNPFQSYGYAEKFDNFLIGTSYYNYNSPLIRYNTNDLINDCLFNDGILTSFKVSDGRVGEFVVDLSNTKISLTSLIFGRHHLLFNHSSFIQVKQLDVGYLEIFYVSEIINPNDASQYFDSKNLNFVLKFTRIMEPFRSISGKVNLLIK